jgi:hypothetical protein
LKAGRLKNASIPERISLLQDALRDADFEELPFNIHEALAVSSVPERLRGCFYRQCSVLIL